MSVVAFARAAREEIENDLRFIETSILSGVKTWDDYVRLTGQRRGVTQALEKLDEVMERFDRQE